MGDNLLNNQSFRNLKFLKNSLLNHNLVDFRHCLDNLISLQDLPDHIDWSVHLNIHVSNNLNLLNHLLNDGHHNPFLNLNYFLNYLHSLNYLLDYLRDLNDFFDYSGHHNNPFNDLLNFDHFRHFD